MKSIIKVTSVLLLLTGCGDSNQFSASSQEGQKGRPTGARHQRTGGERDFPGNEDAQARSGGGEKSGDRATSAKGGFPEDFKAGSSQTQRPDGSPVTGTPPSKSTDPRSSETAGTDKQAQFAVKQDIAAQVSTMVSNQGASLSPPQQAVMEKGLVDLSAALIDQPAGAGAALTQVIDLAQKLNALKASPNLKAAAVPGALPANLPVGLPALADAAVIADFAAALADIGAAAAALDVAGVVAALQDLIALIMDLIG